jgi:hypothetical protein
MEKYKKAFQPFEIKPHTDGKSVKIWGDKWIDSTFSGKIQAPV